MTICEVKTHVEEAPELTEFTVEPGDLNLHLIAGPDNHVAPPCTGAIAGIATGGETPP